jgi:hypothetical protein
MYSQKINGQIYFLGGSYVFSKHLMSPIKWIVGCSRLQKSNNFKHWEKETCESNKDLTNQKSNKTREKTSEAW